MNPMEWKREHRLAGLVICAIGAILGMLFAWSEDSLYQLCHSSLSGEWANCTRAFLLWFPEVELYWPWPMIGALLAGLAFYAARLLMTSNLEPSETAQPRTRYALAGHVEAGPAPQLAQAARGSRGIISEPRTERGSPAHILRKLWWGKYSLIASFWGFFVLGVPASVFPAVFVVIPFAALHMRPIGVLFSALGFAGYWVVAAMGVWRSADSYPYTRWWPRLAKSFVSLLTLGAISRLANGGALWLLAQVTASN
jgi:hypothetical protein